MQRLFSGRRNSRNAIAHLGVQVPSNRPILFFCHSLGGIVVKEVNYPIQDGEPADSFVFPGIGESLFQPDV